MLGELDDDRSPLTVAVQVHTWIHGIVDLNSSHPDVRWPAVEEQLIGLRSASYRRREASARRSQFLPRNRATLRNPVWATMRWSGRTAWPSMCQPRCSTSTVRASIHLPLSASRAWAACVIDGV